MKRLFLLLSLLGVHLEFSFGDEPIRSELIQLHQSIPLDRLRILLAEYIVQDAQFRRSLQYMRSPEFAEVWNRFVNNEKVRVWLQYIDDAGLPVNKVLAMFTDFTGTARVKRCEMGWDVAANATFNTYVLLFITVIQKRKGGLSAFVDDALKIVSSSEMVEFHEMQKTSNPQYKETIDKLTAPEFGQMMKDILVSRCLVAMWSLSINFENFLTGGSRGDRNTRAGEKAWNRYCEASWSNQVIFRMESNIMSEIYKVLVEQFLFFIF